MILCGCRWRRACSNPKLQRIIQQCGLLPNSLEAKLAWMGSPRVLTSSAPQKSWQGKIFLRFNLFRNHSFWKPVGNTWAFQTTCIRHRVAELPSQHPHLEAVPRGGGVHRVLPPRRVFPPGGGVICGIVLACPWMRCIRHVLSVRIHGINQFAEARVGMEALLFWGVLMPLGQGVRPLRCQRCRRTKTCFARTFLLYYCYYSIFII